MLQGQHPENNIVATVKDVPIVKRPNPLPVKSLHQIEVSSFCSLRCSYCVSPTLERTKVEMTKEHLLSALEHVKYYVRQGTQHELNPCGIGEATEHSHWIEFLEIMRSAVGPDVHIIFATNGLSAAKAGGEELVKAMVPFNPSVFVSLHRPEKARIAAELYQKYGLLKGVSQDPVLNSMDWGGKVAQQGLKQTYVAPCTWQRQGWAMAMADGRVTACCLDGSGAGTIGHVNDPVGSLKTKPYDLCLNCHQEIGIEGFNQRDPKSYGLPTPLPIATTPPATNQDPS